jgi:hypothetical protein
MSFALRGGIGLWRQIDRKTAGRRLPRTRRDLLPRETALRREQAASSRPAAAPANFRSSLATGCRRTSSGGSRFLLETKKANEDMSLDRLDPFYKPKAAERPAVPEPEAEEPLPTDEIEREKKGESERKD